MTIMNMFLVTMIIFLHVGHDPDMPNPNVNMPDGIDPEELEDWIINGGLAGALGRDVSFLTRSLEAMPCSPSEWGPDYAGGDGTIGVLGPAIVANPGEKVHIFVKNNLGAFKEDLGRTVRDEQSYWYVVFRLFISHQTERRYPYPTSSCLNRNRMEALREENRNNFIAPWIAFTGPAFDPDLFPYNMSENVPVDELKAGAGHENVPGLETGKFEKLNVFFEISSIFETASLTTCGFVLADGWDVLNLHMHGWEVAPHLFHPMGTSNVSFLHQSFPLLIMAQMITINHFLEHI